jgi:hypothetical protein
MDTYSDRVQKRTMGLRWHIVLPDGLMVRAKNVAVQHNSRTRDCAELRCSDIFPPEDLFGAGDAQDVGEPFSFGPSDLGLWEYSKSSRPRRELAQVQLPRLNSPRADHG